MQTYVKRKDGFGKVNPQLFIKDGLMLIELFLIYISAENVFQNSGLFVKFICVPEDILSNEDQDLSKKSLLYLKLEKHKELISFSSLKIVLAASAYLFSRAFAYKFNLPIEDVITSTSPLVLVILETPSFSLLLLPLWVWVAQE